MKMKKVFMVLVAAAMIFGMASREAACGGSNEQKVKTTLNVGTSADYPPYEFIILDSAGQKKYAGIDISLAEQLALDLGLTLEIVNMSFDNLMASLQKGEIDVVLAAIEVNEERTKVASFSDPYYLDLPPMILVRASEAAGFTSLESFTNKTVGAQIGTTKADLVGEKLPKASLLAVSNVTDLVNNLVYNKCDAIVLDAAVAQQYAERNDNLAIAKVEVGITAPYVASVKKGDPLKLLDSFNKTIKRVTSDGSVEKWVEEADALSAQAIE
ncbi:MAG: transporter substrate-binding domain-containing protein [Treponema sp.]|jgi:polar amino acid transport system substrate-binding protein|nr:transporter substrate-binding domain-containing protein [Treponema sp.]